jgi:hypothetical protein
MAERTGPRAAGALLALALGLGLAACGGGSSSSEGEGEISAVIEKAVTSDDPAKCTELMTQNFIEQTSDAAGGKAVEECEEEAKSGENDPESVAVSEVEVDGRKATADAAFVGGSFDGQTLTVALVKDGGGWKLDEIEGFANLDRGALTKALSEQLEATGQLTEAQTSCIVEGIEAGSDKAFEELLLSGSSDALRAIAEGCE